MNRICRAEGCKAEVRHKEIHAGYCSAKSPHWNEPIHQWGRPDCECGTDKLLKEKPSAGRGHAYWCEVFRWEEL